MQSVAWAIKAHGLRRTFSGNRHALGFGDFEIPQGKIVAVVGASGVGKTTLLNAISGVDDLELGQGGFLTIQGKDGACHDVLPDAAYPRHEVSNVFQKGYLLEAGSAALNIASALSLADLDFKDRDLGDFLEVVGLSRDFADNRPWQLSGGEAQRVGIARALARGTTLMFADEPTSSLDRKSAKFIMELFVSWRETHHENTLVWICHDLALVQEYADYLLIAMPGDFDAVANQQNVTLRLAENPRSSEALTQLLQPNQQEAPVQAKPIPRLAASASGPLIRRRFAGKRAVSELLKRRDMFRSTTSTPALERLHTLSSRWDPGWFKPTTFLRTLRAFSLGNVLSICLMAILVTTVLASMLLNTYRAHLVTLADPENCTLVVSGGQRKVETETGTDTQVVDITSQLIGQLALRPWAGPPQPAADTGAEIWQRASCTQGPAAFGRRDFARAFVCEDEFPTGSGSITIPLLVTSGNEPLLSNVRVTAGDYAGQDLKSLSFDDPDNQFLYTSKQIFVSEFMMDEFTRAKIDVTDGLCVEYQGYRETMTVEGVVDSFPSPRRQRFEAFITDKTLTESLRAASNSFSQAQIYFDPRQLKQVERYLNGAGLEFVGESTERLNRLVRASYNALLLISSATLSVALLFCVIMVSITRGSLRDNAQAFAVLQTMGLTWRGAARQLVIQLWTLMSLAAVGAALVLVVIWYLLTTVTGLSTSTELLEWLTIMLGGVAAFALFLLVIIVRVVRSWFMAQTRRSEVLG